MSRATETRRKLWLACRLTVLATLLPTGAHAELLGRFRGHPHFSGQQSFPLTTSITTTAAAAFQASCGTAPYASYPAHWHWDASRITGVQPRAATAAMNLTPRIEQWRGGSLLATYTRFSGDTACNEPGRKTHPQDFVSVPGCEGPFNANKYVAWEPGDIFYVHPAVYKDNLYLAPQIAWSGTINFTINDPHATVADTSEFSVGDTVDATTVWVPDQTHILSIEDGTHFTMDQNAAQTGSVSTPILRKPDQLTIQGLTENVGGIPTRPVMLYDESFNTTLSLNKAMVYMYGQGGDGDIGSITFDNIDVAVKPPPAGQQHYYVANDPFALVYMSGTQINGTISFSNMRVNGAMWVGSGPGVGAMGLFKGVASASRRNHGLIKMDRMEFFDNGGKAGPAHHVYINEGSERIEVTNSYFHRVFFGHLFKDRLVDSYFAGNYFEGGGFVDQFDASRGFVEGQDYGESNDLDIPCGGNATLENNIFTKKYSYLSHNGSMVDFQEGDCTAHYDWSERVGPTTSLTVKHNTFVDLSPSFTGDATGNNNQPLLVNGNAQIDPTVQQVLPGDSRWPLGAYDISDNVFVGFCPSPGTGNQAALFNFPWYGTQQVNPTYPGTIDRNIVADFSDIRQDYSLKTDYEPIGDDSVVGTPQYAHLAATDTRKLNTAGAMDAVSSGTDLPTSGPSMLFRAPDQGYLVPVGGTTTLTWEGAGAVHCTASGGWSGDKGISGTEVVSPPGSDTSTVYALHCVDQNGGTSDDSVTLRAVSAPTMVSYLVTPDTGAAGSQRLISWATTNANNCLRENGWSNSVVANYNDTVFRSLNGVAPTQTLEYSMLCSGVAGDTGRQYVTATVTGTIEKPSLWMTVTANKPAKNANVTITWDSRASSSCTGSGLDNTGGSQPFDTGGLASGSVSFLPPQYPLSTVYTITCTGAGGTSIAHTQRVTPLSS